MNKTITINSRKFDNNIHRSWKCNLLDQNNSFLLFVGEFEQDVLHDKLGLIRCGTISYEYYWRNQWFNIFRFHEPEGNLRNFYCNVNMPPVFDGDVLDYVDLDVDVLVWSDFRFEILDWEEFEENAIKFSYSDGLKLKVKKTLDVLVSKIESREFPFENSDKKLWQF